jgi:hypothetical protein
MNEGEAIVVGANLGSAAPARLLLRDERVNPAARNCIAFIDAVSNGNHAMVKLFLEDSRVNPLSFDGVALDFAIQLADLDMVKILLPLGPWCLDKALLLALHSRKPDVIRYLLAVTDLIPQIGYLEQAIRSANYECVAALLDSGRVQVSKPILDVTVQFGTCLILGMVLRASNLDLGQGSEYSAIRIAAQTENREALYLLLCSYGRQSRLLSLTPSPRFPSGIAHAFARFVLKAPMVLQSLAEVPHGFLSERLQDFLNKYFP